MFFMPLDPVADLRIFVWPKIPLLLLSLPLTDMWGPSVSFSFNLLPPLCHALHTSPPCRHQPAPCREGQSPAAPSRGPAATTAAPFPPPAAPPPPLRCERGKLRRRRSGLGAAAAVGPPLRRWILAAGSRHDHGWALCGGLPLHLLGIYLHPRPVGFSNSTLLGIGPSGQALTLRNAP